MTERNPARDLNKRFKAPPGPIKAVLLGALILGILGLFAAACQPAASPTATPTSATTIPKSPTATQSPAATETPAPSVPSIYGTVFHDWNGNGKQDSIEAPGEPALPGIQVCLDDGDPTLCAVSDESGQYLIEQVPPGEHSLWVESDQYSYLFPSVDAAVVLEVETLPVIVDGAILVDIGLGEGPLTLPFLCTEMDQVVGVSRYFDADIHPGQARDWTGGSQTVDGYLGTTFEFQGEVEIVAPAPATVTHVTFWEGRYLVQLGCDIVPWFPDNRSLQLYFSGMDEISVKKWDIVARGQTIGRATECHPEAESGVECFTIRGRYPDTYGSHVFVDLFRDTETAGSRSLWTRDNDPVCFPGP
jgi:hypothetical protein